MTENSDHRLSIVNIDLITSEKYDSGNVDAFLADRIKKLRTLVNMACVITNDTSYRLFDCFLLVGYRSGGGGSKAGFSIPPRTISTILFDEPGQCIWQANGAVFYMRNGVKTEYLLPTKTAPEGKCFTRVPWPLVEKGEGNLIMATEEFRPE